MTSPSGLPPEARKGAGWHRGAIIYQVYPRSFQDSNNDGIGDLPGLIQRLPYIAGLGVDAIWVSPFFKSPQKDYGYDISAYREVDPIFGAITDCDRLIAECHRLDLRVIFDVVLSHSSDQHPWFQDSRRRLNGKDNWYVWADPKPDGSPPTNWVSLFGGPAWEYDPLRGQYYLHNFLKEQPDLNFHEPEVQTAMLDVAKFWLDRGVDGLRLDVVNFYFHDRQLRDNPARPPELGFALQYHQPDPYSMQRHLYDKSQPENLLFVERLRALTDTYPDRMLVGEIGDDHQIACMAEYTRGDARLHTAYCFKLLTGTDVNLTPAFVREAVESELFAESWPSWAFSNHDVPRSISRLGQRHITNPDWPKMLLALLLCLRGTLCLYQGEELGLPEANVPQEKLQDPWGKRVWPIWQGRDGCRTPMPWNGALSHYGFTGGDPWLPAAPEHQGLDVATQEANPNSMLAFARSFIAFRKSHPALVWGDIVFLDAGDSVLSFARDHLICVFNLKPEPAAYPCKGDMLFSNQADISGDGVAFSGFGFAVLDSNALA